MSSTIIRDLLRTNPFSSQKSLLFAKKLGGVFAMIVGGLIAAIGADVESSTTIAIGILFVIVGAILLALKIIRRNEGGPAV